MYSLATYFCQNMRDLPIGLVGCTHLTVYGFIKYKKKNDNNLDDVEICSIFVIVIC